MLFRFSALTFNGHRIHYDLDYVRNEEHYPGLVVHGPLQTLLCSTSAAATERDVRKLDYRALHPVFHTERMTINGNPMPTARERICGPRMAQELCDDGNGFVSMMNAE